MPQSPSGVTHIFLNIITTFEHLKCKIIRHYFICADNEQIEFCVCFCSMWIGQEMIEILAINRSCLIAPILTMITFTASLHFNVKPYMVLFPQRIRITSIFANHMIKCFQCCNVGPNIDHISELVVYLIYYYNNTLLSHWNSVNT